MAPWDELLYYFAPKETVLTNVPVNTVLVNANPMRVGLGFFLSTPGVMIVSTALNPQQNQGWTISQQNLALWLNARDHPTLVQAQWVNTVAVGVGQLLTVVEVIMPRWPVGIAAQGESSWLSRLIRSLKNT